MAKSGKSEFPNGGRVGSPTWEEIPHFAVISKVEQLCSIFFCVRFPSSCIFQVLQATNKTEQHIKPKDEVYYCISYLIGNKLLTSGPRLISYLIFVTYGEGVDFPAGVKIFRKNVNFLFFGLRFYPNSLERVFIR